LHDIHHVPPQVYRDTARAAISPQLVHFMESPLGITATVIRAVRTCLSMGDVMFTVGSR
jgi:hypothetical protein